MKCKAILKHHVSARHWTAGENTSGKELLDQLLSSGVGHIHHQITEGLENKIKNGS